MPRLPPQIGLPEQPAGPEPAPQPAGRGGVESLGESRARRGLRPGQLDEAASGWARRQKELAGRHAFLKNFWYAAGASPSSTLV